LFGACRVLLCGDCVCVVKYAREAWVDSYYITSLLFVCLLSTRMPHKRSPGGKRSGSMAGSGPPQMRANIEAKHQYRFTSNSGTLVNITDSLLLTAAGVMATSATVGHALFNAVKLHKVEIWAPPAAQGAATTCSVLWPAGNNSPSREVSDTSVSVTKPAHIVSSPPPNSLCGFWNSGSGFLVMSLTAPPGSIIDVWLSLVVVDGAPQNSVTATLVASAAGYVTYCSLDSSTAAGSKYPPVSLTTL
jgi:hypothetical protein